MERNHIDDVQNENDNKGQILNNSIISNGNFNELSTQGLSNCFESPEDKNSYQTSVNNFLMFPPKIDTNSIWKTNLDVQRCFSVPDAAVGGKVDSINNDLISTIWNCKVENGDCNSNMISKRIMGNSLSVSESVANQSADQLNGFSDINDDNSDDAVVFDKENESKMMSMINSHDGWGVKPINQKTPWEMSDAACNNNSNENVLSGVTIGNSDGYPDTFTNWLNDTGASAWETYEANRVNQISVTSPLASIVGGGGSGATNPTIQSWSSVTNDNNSPCNWSNVIGANISTNAIQPAHVANGYTSPELPTNHINNVRPLFNRMQSEQMKKSSNCWMQDSKSVNDFQSTNVNSDNYHLKRNNKKLDVELQRYKLYKDAQRQMTGDILHERQRILEIEKSMSNMNKLGNNNHSRGLINDLMMQYDVSLNRIKTLQYQLDSLNKKLIPLEEVFHSYFQRDTSLSSNMNMNINKNNNTQPQFNNASNIKMNINNKVNANNHNIDSITNKIGFMRVQSTQDFRLDVPEFVPGKKWYGVNQNGKENRIPSHISTSSIAASSYGLSNSMNSHEMNSNANCCWLLIQQLPSHVNIDMMYSFFNQHQTACITPIHCNPFSRWMLVKFHTSHTCQRAYQLLAGKIGSVSLISDQEANMRLQELKGAMANFVAHQN